MTRDVIGSREAQADIAEAIAELHDISPPLPERFGVELDRVYSSIAEYPEMYPVVYKIFR